MLNDVFQDLLEEGLPLLGEHIVLVLTAILIASAIAIPAESFCWHRIHADAAGRWASQASARPSRVSRSSAS